MVPCLHPHQPFPPIEQALGPASGAPGLLAASIELTPEQLLAAYRKGIFPWYSEGQPVLWWSPDPRMVLAPTEFKISASLKKTLRRVLREPAWEIRVNTCFAKVIATCAHTRLHTAGTWITEEVMAAYTKLHELGFAHSVETWYEGQLVGGLYGVSIGTMFFGESMFAQRTDASKIALTALINHLRQHQVGMVDCQQNTAHLASLGAREIPRAEFAQHLTRVIDSPPIPWGFDKSVLVRVE